MTEYPPGTPCWVDVSSPDMEASKAFYGGLFGWEAHASPDPAAGGYTFFTLGPASPAEIPSRVVAALMPAMGEGQPAAWNTYISVADADAAAKLAAEAGGQALMPPMDVMDQGRLAMFADDQGSVIGAWQPLAFKGAALVNDPGCFAWNELACRDIDKAKRFYGQVFGWGADTSQMGPMIYTEWKLGDRSIGGMAQMDENWPAEVPPHWMVYFSVDDCDAAAARVAELGGKVSIPPTDIQPGRFSVVNDPHGAVFTLFKMAEPTA